MSREHVEIVRRAIDDFNNRRIDTYDDLYTSDFEWFPALTGTIEGRSYRGRDGLETWYAESLETWEEFRVLADELRDLGGRVLGLGRIVGRGRSSGLELDAPMGMIVDLHGGKISRSLNYLDRREALRAVGLAE